MVAKAEKSVEMLIWLNPVSAWQ